MFSWKFLCTDLHQITIVGVQDELNAGKNYKDGISKDFVRSYTVSISTD